MNVLLRNPMLRVTKRRPSVTPTYVSGKIVGFPPLLFRTGDVKGETAITIARALETLISTLTLPACLLAFV